MSISNHAPIQLEGSYLANARRFSLRISERRVLLLLGDALILLLCSVAALSLWVAFRPDIILTGEFFLHHLAWLVALPVAWLMLMMLAGGYDLKHAARVYDIVQRILIVAIIFGVGYLFFFFLSANQPRSLYSSILGDLPVLRVQPAIFVVLAVLFELAWRASYATFLTRGHFRRRLLVVGAGVAGQTFLEAYRLEQSTSAYQVVGLIDDDASKQSVMVEDVPVLGTHERLVDIALHQGVDELVLAISHDLGGGMFQSVMDCFERGIQVTPMPVLYESLTGRVPVEHVGKHWYVSLPIGATPPSRFYQLIERFADIIVALVGLTLLGVIIPFVMLCNRLSSQGPLFFWQKRVGRAGRHYMMVKFRSMIPDAEKRSGAVWAQENDPRITKFGNFLRKSRLDELPQFWNVLKGEMSLVGPRPERPEFVEQLARQIPFYRSRHAVKPGLTGWAQVKYRYGASVEDSLIKLQYDLYYIKWQSLWLNAVILYKTIRVVFGLKGR